MLPNFYYHPRMLSYDFGPRHPLKPERLRRAITLFEAMGVDTMLDPGLGRREDALRVHAEDYLHAIDLIGSGEHLPGGYGLKYGFGSTDNPPFEHMLEASLAYTAGSVAAAECVRDGAPLAFNVSGGLHHAQRAKASGFCILDDPAIAVHVLLERFQRVAYVDIDVHHGDGVEALWRHDPRVLTCSIHQSGHTLYPGTGHAQDVGPHFTSVNVPLMPESSGETWIWAFEQGILESLHLFQPQAIVLQMGTDPHAKDPLAHLRVRAQDWLQAVIRVRDLGVPIVALGGGGYNLTTVPRMWVAACLNLGRIPFEDALPGSIPEDWGMPTFSDAERFAPPEAGRSEAEGTLSLLRQLLHPHIPRP